MIYLNVSDSCLKSYRNAGKNDEGQTKADILIYPWDSKNQKAGENKRKWSNVEVGILGDLTLLFLTLLRDWERDE